MLDHVEYITMGHDQPVPDAGVRIVRVSECLGRRWAVSVRRRTVYYLATLPAAEVAVAIMEGTAALAEHDRLPKLQLVHSTRLTREAERSAG